MTKRLHEELGIGDFVLRWFESYLHNRVQKDGPISHPFDLCYGALQGSYLGPILLIIYASTLLKITEHELKLPSTHCYADDNPRVDPE